MPVFIRIHVVIYILPLFAACVLNGCANEQSHVNVTTISDEEAERFAESIQHHGTVNFPESLELTLWASEYLMGDPVGISMDDQGRAWVNVTSRQILGISEFRDRLVESLGWDSIEHKKAFLMSNLDPSKSEQNSWLPDRNQDGSHDWRDLTVLKESVYRLEDLTGNGMANQSQLFWSGFNQVHSDLAASILHYNDDVFVAAAPDIWRLTDLDGDGAGDQKVSISHGYGVHIGIPGHMASGLTIGPDGRIYWAIGDIGANVVDKEGKRWYFPHEGAIMRSDPDGSNFEVFASGLRNTHEFAFDKFGNLITVDNDGDFPGETERLIHVINGSDSGWRIHWQFGKYSDPRNNSYNVWVDEGYFKPRFTDQAAHLLPPLASSYIGPAGMTYNPGTALNEEWKDHFFVASFTGSIVTSKVYAFTLQEHGASFKPDQEQVLVEGIAVTGIDFGPDGALYMNDWAGESWWTNGDGRIWRIDASEYRDTPVRINTRELLSEAFERRSDEYLISLLAHEDMRVRRKAQFELAARDAASSLLNVVESEKDQLARIHGIWGMGQIGRRDLNIVDPLKSFLQDSDPEIRAQIARVLGDVRYEPAADALISLLNDEHPRVRLYAAEAIGRIGYQPAMNMLVRMLESNDDKDVYLRHAGAIALSRTGTAEAIADLHTHPSRAVRIAAVVALRRMESPEISRFFSDEDEYIVTNTARAVNDDNFIYGALPELAQLLDQDVHLNEPLIRRSINANLYEGKFENAKRLVRFAMQDQMESNLRVEALKTLASWSEPSMLDRVTGRYRGELRNDPDLMRSVVEPVLEVFLEAVDDQIKIAALELAIEMQSESVLPVLHELFFSNEESDEVRIKSLYALLTLNELLALPYQETLSQALEDPEEQIRIAALGMIFDLGYPEDNLRPLFESVLDTGTIKERRVVYSTLGEMGNTYAREILKVEMDRLIHGDLPPEIELDLIMAIERVDAVELNNLLRDYKSSKPENDLLQQYIETLYGGDAERGRSIFYHNVGSQCARCHVVGGEGVAVGPDLTVVGERLSREEILQSLVEPNARISPGYGMITIESERGETLTGVYMGTTENGILISVNNEVQTILHSEILRQQFGASSMPSMITQLSHLEIRDLVEFLSGLSRE